MKPRNFGRTIDLHLHSTFSDGMKSPVWLADLLLRAGHLVVSLTDHDTLAGTAPFRRACRRLGLATVSGVEISSLWAGTEGQREVHLLAYGLPLQHTEVEELLAGIREHRRSRFREMADRLATMGILLPEEKIVAQLESGNSGRPQLARLLIDGTHVKNMDEAFSRFLGEDGAVWLPKVAPECTEVIQRVHEWGGLVFVAHPGKSLLPADWPRILAAGADGLECRHPAHGRALGNRLLELCRTQGKLSSAGSDFHGWPEQRSYRNPEWALSQTSGALRELLLAAIAELPKSV